MYYKKKTIIIFKKLVKTTDNSLVTVTLSKESQTARNIFFAVTIFTKYILLKSYRLIMNNKIIILNI